MMNNDEIEKLKFFGSKCYDLIGERFRTIIYVIELMIALLVIATFSEEIIPKSNIGNLKILITFLLSLTPIMLADYMLKINDGINSLQKAITQIENVETEKKKWYFSLIDGSNYIYFLIQILVIYAVIFLIYQNFLIPFIIFLFHFIIIATLCNLKNKQAKEKQK